MSIFESPGRNYLRWFADFGPAWLGSKMHLQDHAAGDTNNLNTKASNRITLSTFLDFAIGACECLELLHHGLRVVHGELRADAFHFNHDTGAVKIINFGSGPRSFENGLTSKGWIALSREIGAKHKLQYIAPEQTGRMPAEPDSRTDLYSLGVLFWTMLTGKPAFEGETLIDIVQAVLGRRLPLVSSERLDIPDVISKIIQKMTQKQIDERYHSTSGLRHDFVTVQRFLGDGDTEALDNFIIGSKDVPSFFMLPTAILGRSEEREKIVKVMEKVARRQQNLQDPGSYNFGTTSTSTLSERPDSLEIGTRSSETSSVTGKMGESPALGPSNTAKVFDAGGPPLSHDSTNDLSLASKPPLEPNNSEESVDTTVSVDTQTTIDTQKSSNLRPDYSSGHRNAPSSIPIRRESHQPRRRHRCEIISIFGAAGLGKSSLIQSTQSEVRKFGYFASAKFDPARKAPYESLIRAMGSLFRQVFSDSDVNSEYHDVVRKHISPFWPVVRVLLDLPEDLLSAESQHFNKNAAYASQHGTNRPLRLEANDTSSMRSSQVGSLSAGSLATSEVLRGGSNLRSMKFVTIFVAVLRILSANKLICLCLDDIQFADEESLDLISAILGKKIGIIILTTCRDEGTLAKSVENVIRSSSANVTTLKLSPLSEEEIIEYVALTMYRERQYVSPLAMVCLEKTNGNPFYLRQMLEVCYRKVSKASCHPSSINYLIWILHNVLMLEIPSAHHHLLKRCSISPIFVLGGSY